MGAEGGAGFPRAWVTQVLAPEDCSPLWFQRSQDSCGHVLSIPVLQCCMLGQVAFSPSVSPSLAFPARRQTVPFSVRTVEYKS